VLFIAEHQGAKHKRSAAQELDNHRYSSKGKGKGKGKGFAGSNKPSQKGKGKGKSKGSSKGNSKGICLSLVVNLAIVTLSFGCAEGKEHGAAMHTVDFSSNPGNVGLGGRFFDIKQCVDNLVTNHSFDRDRASRMCFPVGLTLFQGSKALRCCGLAKTPGHESMHSKFHAFPDGWANEMRSAQSNNRGNFRQPAPS
jgi:hypothetical protein